VKTLRDRSRPRRILGPLKAVVAQHSAIDVCVDHSNPVRSDLSHSRVNG
jgi:hypothetical protein